jgi:hypothetical protein
MNQEIQEFLLNPNEERYVLKVKYKDIDFFYQKHKESFCDVDVDDLFLILYYQLKNLVNLACTVFLLRAVVDSVQLLDLFVQAFVDFVQVDYSTTVFHNLYTICMFFQEVSNNHSIQQDQQFD